MYTAIYAMLVLLALGVSNRNATGWLGLVMMFLLFFMGTRYYVGCDFGSYLNRFDNISMNSDIWRTFEMHEPGFEFLITGVRLLGLDYMWLNIFASAIILACYFFFLRTHFRPLMIIALMFPMIIVQLSMSGVRQGIAVAMLAAASVHFVRGQRLWTAGWILLGAQFHSSVLVLLPIALLAGKTVSTFRVAIAAALLAPISVILLGERADVYTDRYVDQIYGDMSSAGAVYRYGAAMIPFLIFPFVRRSLKTTFPEKYEVIKLFAIIGFSLAPLLILSPIILHRLNYYILPLSIVTLVYVSEVLFMKNKKAEWRLFPAATFLAYFISWQMTSKHADVCFSPYQSYLFI
jgi:hypothetical protein